MENKLLITCECNVEVLSLSRFEDEEEVYLVIYKYLSPSYSFFARIKLAWKVLIGHGYIAGDVVLSEENFNRIKDF